MSENTPRYQVRDPQGNIYGPADAPTLRDWVQQGRIVAGMHIADQADGQWVEVSVHPALADLFSGAAAAPMGAPSATTTPVTRVVPSSSMPSPMAVGGPMAPASDPGTLGYDSQTPRQNVPGLISLIAAMVGAVSLLVGCVPICGCIGFPMAGLLGLTAIILGAIGLMQIKGDSQRYTGRSMAMTGLCTGIGILVLMVVVVIGSILLNVMHH